MTADFYMFNGLDKSKGDNKNIDLTHMISKINDFKPAGSHGSSFNTG